MVTPAPSSWVGRLGPTKSAAVQMRVVPARLAPLTVTHEPCENPGRKLPPLSTSVMRGVPGAAGAASAASARRGDQGEAAFPHYGSGEQGIRPVAVVYRVLKRPVAIAEAVGGLGVATAMR